jgi:hypothetical protein
VKARHATPQEDGAQKLSDYRNMGWGPWVFACKMVAVDIMAIDYDNRHRIYHKGDDDDETG